MRQIFNDQIYYQIIIPDIYHGLLTNINNIINNYSLYQEFSDATFNGGSDQTNSPRSCIYQKNKYNPSVKFGLMSAKSSGAFEESSYTASTPPNLAFRIKLNDNTSISPYQQNTLIPSYIYNEYIKVIIAENRDNLVICLSGLIIVFSILYYRSLPHLNCFVFNTAKDSIQTLNRRYSYIYFINNAQQGGTSEIIIRDPSYTSNILYNYDSTSKILELNSIFYTIRIGSSYYMIPLIAEDLFNLCAPLNVTLDLFEVFIDNNNDRYLLLGGSEYLFIKI